MVTCLIGFQYQKELGEDEFSLWMKDVLAWGAFSVMHFVRLSHLGISFYDKSTRDHQGSPRLLAYVLPLFQNNTTDTVCLFFTFL